MTTDTEELRELLLLMNRERMMLADLSWYWDEGMPATAYYLERAFNIHDAAPALLDELDRLRAELAEAREELAEAYVKLSGKDLHASDCATSSAPAMKPGPCDCSEHRSKSDD